MSQGDPFAKKSFGTIWDVISMNKRMFGENRMVALRLCVIAIALGCLSGARPDGANTEKHWVRPHYRNGHYVKGHYRTNRNNTIWDNYEINGKPAHIIQAENIRNGTSTRYVQQAGTSNKKGGDGKSSWGFIFFVVFVFLAGYGYFEGKKTGQKK